MIKVLSITQIPALECKYITYLPKSIAFYQRINATYKVDNEIIHYYEFSTGKCVFSFSIEEDELTINLEQFKLLVKKFGHVIK